MPYSSFWPVMEAEAKAEEKVSKQTESDSCFPASGRERGRESLPPTLKNLCLNVVNTLIFV